MYARLDVPGLWWRRWGDADAAAEPLLADLAVDDHGSWLIRPEGLYWVSRGERADRILLRGADGQDQEVLQLPRQALRYYRALDLAADGSLVLTILGRRQADIVALRVR